MLASSLKSYDHIAYARNIHICHCMSPGIYALTFPRNLFWYEAMHTWGWASIFSPETQLWSNYLIKSTNSMNVLIDEQKRSGIVACSVPGKKHTAGVDELVTIGDAAWVIAKKDASSRAQKKPAPDRGPRLRLLCVVLYWWNAYWPHHTCKPIYHEIMRHDMMHIQMDYKPSTRKHTLIFLPWNVKSQYSLGISSKLRVLN